MTVTADSYWLYHFDFGISCKSYSALLGMGRAAEIVLNIILPFFFAWAESNSHASVKDEILALYFSYTRRGWNKVSCLMLNRVLGNSMRDIVDSARRQQGLLHLYQCFCSNDSCYRCPLVVGRAN